MKYVLYTLLFMVGVIFPALFLAAYSINSEDAERYFSVTDGLGSSAIQCQSQHPDSEIEKWHQKNAPWIPLEPGTRIGPNDRIKTGEKSYLDIMKEGRIALRIKRNTLVGFMEKDLESNESHVFLSYGRITCRVEKKEDKILRVATPTTVATIRGTTFTVEHVQRDEETTVEVLTGAVEVQDKNNPDSNVLVKEGDDVKVSVFTGQLKTHKMAMNEQQKIQTDLKELKIKTEGLDRVSQALSMDVFSPIMFRVISRIAKNEMRTFAKEIKYIGRYRRSGKLPDSLRIVDLEEGDYQDPWENEYFYKRISSTKAVIISLGPDKKLHTGDDITISIVL